MGYACAVEYSAAPAMATVMVSALAEFIVFAHLLALNLSSLSSARGLRSDVLVGCRNSEGKGVPPETPCREDAHFHPNPARETL